MTPAQIRTATIRDLRAAVKGMMSLKWRLALRNKDEATRKEAAVTLARTWHALTELENEALADIAEKLQDNETALTKGREKLQEKLRHLDKIKDVLKAVSRVLDVVAKIVKVAI